MTNMTLMQHCS